jgi:dTDP-glucose pyrophosphorylase
MAGDKSESMTAQSLAKAVVLAAGRGTRMQAARPALALEPAQAEHADRGVKSLIPFHGVPFIAYVLGALADAGFGEVCIVVGAGADAVRRLAESLATSRIRIVTAAQAAPLGSADALLAAEAFTAGDDFAVINADNYYAPASLALLHTLGGSGLVAFRVGILTAAGNVTVERIAAYALVTTDNGRLTDIVEKPAAAVVHRLDPASLVSMTCWRFGPSVYAACRSVPRSTRGEYELPAAVRLMMQRGERLHAAVSAEPVLDLSVRDDIPSVAALLRGVGVRL